MQSVERLDPAPRRIENLDPLDAAAVEDLPEILAHLIRPRPRRDMGHRGSREPRSPSQAGEGEQRKGEMPPTAHGALYQPAGACRAENETEKEKRIEVVLPPFALKEIGGDSEDYPLQQHVHREWQVATECRKSEEQDDKAKQRRNLAAPLKQIRRHLAQTDGADTDVDSYIRYVVVEKGRQRARPEKIGGT